jgi:hypothetical protein
MERNWTAYFCYDSMENEVDSWRGEKKRKQISKSK